MEKNLIIIIIIIIIISSADLVLPLLSASRIVFLEASCSNFNFVILFVFSV